ncbi:UNVERIFIED_CONTAM: hypothetical protein RMT77_005801 [Armadillidium vulgare]
MSSEELSQKCQDLRIEGKETKELIEKMIEREERQKEREEKQKESEEKQRKRRKTEREERRKDKEPLEREKERAHELKMLESQNNNNGNMSSETNSFTTKAPKLPPFSDNVDEIDCYLERFERISEINCWARNDWASHLSALLTGSALMVYSRMSREDSKDYDKLKHSLLTRYNLTEEGYRSRFRNSKPLDDERPM